MQPSGAPEIAAPPSASRLTVGCLVVDRVDAGGISGRILDGVALVLEPSSTAAVTGPSGAGKTTLLHAIAGLVKPDDGVVMWGDADVGSWPEMRRDRWRRDTVGLVFQDFQLLPELGVLDNILLPTCFDHWRRPAELRDRAIKLAARVGLDDFSRCASVLSRGEQQRVAVARALVRRPALLLADEPTASLDPENGARITDMLLEMAEETGATLLIVSHDRAVLDQVGRIYHLEAGAIITERNAPR